MNTAENINSYFDDLIPLAKFSELTGITKKAIYEKIAAGKWRAGHEIEKDPDGKIWVSRTGYQLWVRKGVTPEALKQEQTQFKSSSSSKVKLTTVTKRSSGAPRKLT